MLGEKLKIARKDSGFTQQQVAKVLGIDRSTYSYYESGNTTITVDTLLRLAALFGVEYEWLLSEDRSASFHSSDNALSTYSSANESLQTLADDERKVLAVYRVVKCIGKDDEFLKDLTKYVREK